MEAVDRVWRNARFNMRRFFALQSLLAPVVKNRRVRSVVNRISTVLLLFDKVFHRRTWGKERGNESKRGEKRRGGRAEMAGGRGKREREREEHARARDGGNRRGERTHNHTPHRIPPQFHVI